MRLSCALLIAAATATLLTSGSAAAASGHSTEVLAVASPELTGVGQAVGGAKRSLRYHDNDDRADEEEDEENDDEEERAGGANIYATKKLDQMLASVKRAQNGDDGVELRSLIRETLVIKAMEVSEVEDIVTLAAPLSIDDDSDPIMCRNEESFKPSASTSARDTKESMFPFWVLLFDSPVVMDVESFADAAVPFSLTVSMGDKLTTA